MGNNLALPYKTKHENTIWPSNLHSWTFIPEKWNLCSHKNLYINFHRNFIHNSQKLKQPRCPSIGECLNKVGYILTMENYSAVKRNELFICEKTWMNLQGIMLSEKNQFLKTAYYIIYLIYIKCLKTFF